MLAIREFASFYDELREKYIAYLSNFSDWESYLEHSKANACDPKYYPEIFLQQFKSEVEELYFEQNEFLRPYHPNCSEFQEFCTGSDYTTFKIKSKLGGIRVQVELFNIAKDELYFPRVKWIASVHSALHSLGMLVHVQKSYDFNNHRIALHEVPRLTHVGDREFTSYFSQKLNSPMVILSREENTANTLERNGAPKIGDIKGRWCSRTEKIEPKRLFMERFFFPVEQKMPINNVVEFVGIMKCQSPNRTLQNPNVKISNISRGKKQFWTFEHYPIFHLSYQALRELVDPLPLKQNPYERMYRDFITGENREIRFGCSLCPYKTEGFYKKLQKDHPEIYYYARFLKLLASAKNLITEDREYHYFQSSEII
jgi:hypothetical protein